MRENAHDSLQKELGLFDITWSGLMTIEDANRHADDRAACLNAEMIANGYLLRITLLDEQVLTRDTLALLSNVFADFPRPKRTAMVTRGAIARLQIKRALMRPVLEIFDTPQRALDWLVRDGLSYPPAIQR